MPALLAPSVRQIVLCPTSDFPALLNGLPTDGQTLAVYPPVSLAPGTTCPLTWSTRAALRSPRPLQSTKWTNRSVSPTALMAQTYWSIPHLEDLQSDAGINQSPKLHESSSYFPCVKDQTGPQESLQPDASSLSMGVWSSTSVFCYNQP